MQEASPDKLIDNLSTALGPTPTLAPANRRAGVWLLLAGLIVVGEVFAARGLGLAPHIDSVPSYLVALLIIGTIVAAARAAFREAVPGSDTRLIRTMLFGFIVPLWVGGEAMVFFAEPSAPANFLQRLHGGVHCTLLMVLFALPPTVLVYIMLRRGATTHPARGGILSLLAGVAVGALTMQILCPAQEAAHFLVWHAIPTLGLGLAGFAVGKVVLRW